MLDNLKSALIFLLVGAVISFSIVQCYPKQAVAPVAIPASLELEALKKELAEYKSQKKSVIKEYNCKSGALSKETSIDEEVASKIAKEAQDRSKKIDELVVQQAQLEILLGLGAQIRDVERLRDLQLNNINGQVALGASYDGYELLGASDLDKNHNVYFLKIFKLP